MEILERKVENQVQFWSLLGPFFLLLSIAVLLFKVSAHWYFPIAALVGIPLCVKWKMKGLATALSVLFLLSIIAFQQIDLNERYWHVGMGLAMAFSFIILTLALEEVNGLVNKLQLESQSRLDNFLLLDKKWKVAEEQWISERERGQSDSKVLTQELAKARDEKQTFYKLAQLAKDELVYVRSQHEQLLQDLSYKKQQMAQLKERLEETEITIQGFVNSDSEKQILVLTERLTAIEQEKETLKAQAALAQAENQTCQRDRESLLQEIQTYQEREKEFASHQQSFQEDQTEHQRHVQELQNRIRLLEQEKYTLAEAKATLHQHVEQLRSLEGHHRQLVQQHQMKVQELEGQLKGEHQKSHELRQQYVLLEKQLKQQEEEGQKDIQNVAEAIEAKNKLLDQVRELENSAQEREAALKNQLEQTLQMTRQQVEQAEKEIHRLQEELQNRPIENQNTIPVPSHNRRPEAMYMQLQQQFKEKSQTLDETRRELFYVQETLLALQKEKEDALFSLDGNEKEWQRQFLRANKAYETMQKRYETEIEELESLIHHLMKLNLK